MTRQRLRWLGVLVLILGALSGYSQQATVAEIRESAFRKFSEGEFDDAIPDFAALITALGESKQSQTLMAMEIVYYDLALCHFLTGNFPEADKSFQGYIKKYPHGSRTHDAYVYIADSRRFNGKHQEAIKAYQDALKRYTYAPDLLTDIYASIARCYLALDDWAAAREPLRRAFSSAPDGLRRNRAATLLATAYLKTLDMEHIYRMVPFLLQRDSLASRSIAFNMSALEAGDALFQDERYREAFWIHRLVYPHDEVQVRTEAFLDYLQKSLAYEQRYLTDPRRLMRLQEWIGETESEIKALAEIDNYDVDLHYRIARGYMEALRYREARELFLHLHAFGGAERAEESLFFAFFCSTRLQPWTRAYEIGRKYMEAYPAGEWYDDLTLMMGQMYAKEQNWPEVIRHLSEVLQTRPEHQSAAECLFLLGYAHFMEEQFEQAIVRLQDLRKRFPGSELIPAAVYWTAMASMFHSQYEPAAQDFDLILMDHPSSIYAVDSAFRRAVCNYALGQFELADERLAAFLAANPTHKLAAEATVMRGDVAGGLGQLDEAVRFYQQAMTFPPDQLNIELYNHCTFQAGQILFDAERYADVRAHFQRYIEANRPEANIPQAVYWVGRAMWQVGERAATLRYYRDTMLKYGNDRTALGVDMILDEWVGTTRKVKPEEESAAWNDLQQAMREAARAGDRVATLRLTRLLLFHPSIKDTERERVLSNLLQPESVTNASPAVLETMLDAANARGQTNFAVTIASQILQDFTETDYALDARMLLAQYAIAQARTLPPQSAEAAARFAEAIKHLGVVREVYASSGEAAKALLILGELYREQGKMEEADRCYEDVLGVRGWSNHWPEALYGRGQCAESRREYLKATAFYERIYIMYAGYRQWCAQAYLRRAECLHRAYEDTKAIETLRAMLANPDFESMPEAKQARELLAKLENRS